MNGLQHFTTPTSLKFCLALCFSSGPNSSKFGPRQLSPGWTQLFSIGERDGDNFFRARANPALFNFFQLHSGTKCESNTGLDSPTIGPSPNDPSYASSSSEIGESLYLCSEEKSSDNCPASK